MDYPLYSDTHNYQTLMESCINRGFLVKLSYAAKESRSKNPGTRARYAVNMLVADGEDRYPAPAKRLVTLSVHEPDGMTPDKERLYCGDLPLALAHYNMGRKMPNLPSWLHHREAPLIVRSVSIDELDLCAAFIESQLESDPVFTGAQAWA